MRHRGAVWLLIVLLTSCAEAGIDATQPPPTTIATTTSTASTTTAPAPASSTTGAADDGSLVIDAYTYSLTLADGCYRLEISGEGMEPRVEERCAPPGYWYHYSPYCADDPVGAAGGGAYTSQTTAPCQKPLPPVLYGYLPEDIGFLCLPSAGDQPGEFVPVSFMERPEGGIFLTALPDGSHPTPFPYTSVGTPWGDPPMDAFSRVIYAQCDAAGPWGAPAVEIPLDVLVEIDPALAQEGQAVRLDPGNGGMGLDLAIFAPEHRGMVDLHLTAGTTDLDVGWGPTGWAPTSLRSYPLPAEIAAEAASGWICPDAPVLLVALAPGNPVEVRLDWLSSAEAWARLGLEGVPTGRVPGQPCPDGGSRATSRPTLHFTSAYDGYYRFEVAADLLALGHEWGFLVRSLDAGWNFDLAHLAASPGERYWGYLFPGTAIQVGIEPPEAAEPGAGSIAVLIPEIPPGLDGPYLLVVTVSGYSAETGRPVLLPEHVALRWEHDEG